ncbi:hypothetical protein ABZ820_34750 [Streptomyces diacarni]|uniref:hypothetical protein n=1 Tax=Streptomyces diacarni TaxID=2800381 RepID=UPI0033C2C98A
MTQEHTMPAAVPDSVPAEWTATYAPAPALSGVLTTVTSRSGTPVAVLRAEYAEVSARGEWTTHGYAWRCPCRRLALGYGPTGFGRALGDARDHVCGVSRG